MNCFHCGEPILPREEKDARDLNGGKDRMHRECMVRSCAGSVGHQIKTCSCFGGIGDGDNPMMTTRENAKCATELFDLLNAQVRRSARIAAPANAHEKENPNGNASK